MLIIKGILWIKCKNYTAHTAYKTKYIIKCKMYTTLAMMATRISGGLKTSDINENGT